MEDISFGSFKLHPNQFTDLIRRLRLSHTLARRSIEEEITELVSSLENFDESLISSYRNDHNLQDESSLSSFLQKRQWKYKDLEIEVFRERALFLFAEDRFGSDVEDIFLRRKSEFDKVLYSLLRVRDSGLARELWIQISEGEISFSQAASQHGEGQEARHSGLIGPVALGNLEPKALRHSLRRLQVGSVSEPEHFGEWHVLLRLEQISPAILDESMRHQLIHQELELWLQDRSTALIEGRLVDPLDYHPRYDRNSDPRSPA
tara:strand:- start:21832 stop:22617 length:786 start_codon:yes stop_codon:yes gene_type:complete